MRILSTANGRIKVLQLGILLVCSVFVLRLFYLQVLQHGYYAAQAEANQLKRYEIPAERGTIMAFDGNGVVPLVLNERRYTIVADPQIIIDKESVALRVADVLKVDADTIRKALDSELRYVILAKKQPKEIREEIEKLMQEGEIVGVFAENTNQRVYPHGGLAAQLLGYVNDDNEGRYGVEQALEEMLSGIAGRVAALTDQNGIPLLATGDNVLEDPVDGADVVLSIDIVMQRQLEGLLKSGLEAARSTSGSAIIMNPYTGEVKAMANYPSYNPAEFAQVTDPLLFTNPAVSSPLEPGSIMKVLTVAAGLDNGSISAGQTYYDPAFFTIGDATVRNVEEDGGAATRSIADILKYSLNTGATWVLMQMGGGELTEEGRKVWYDYMVNRYQLGDYTGIEQGFEEPGFIPDPVDGFGLNIRYANTTFGQGMTATPLQMLAAVASVVNGGTYYKPTLVAGTLDVESGELQREQPEAVKMNVVAPEVSATVVDYMQQALQHNNVTRPVARDGYVIGGKTGTAEIARPEGGYYDDRYNGTYVGFVGRDRPEYVIITRVNEPKIGGYAGTRAAAPIFMSAVNMLIDNFALSSQ
jgi:cell division protein FtsI/penicillin-binding protein 2